MKNPQNVNVNQEIRLVDTVIVNNDQANEVLVNGVKRRAVAPPSIEVIASSSNAVKNVPVNRVEKKMGKKKKRSLEIKLVDFLLN